MHVLTKEIPNLTPELLFRTEDFKYQRKGESMSRKVVKRFLLFLMFGATILGMYTFFSGVNDSTERGGLSAGLVNNMNIDQSLFNQGSKKKQDNAEEKDSHDNDQEFIHLDIDKLENKGETYIDRLRQAERVRMAEKALKKEEEEEQKNEEKKENKDDNEINIRDQRGEVIGQKLFPFGMSKKDIVKHKKHIKQTALGANVAVNDHGKESGIVADRKSEADENDKIAINADDNDNEKQEANNPRDRSGENVEKEADVKDDSETQRLNSGPGNIENRDTRNDLVLRNDRGQVIGQRLFPFGMKRQDSHQEEVAKKANGENVFEDLRSGDKSDGQNDKYGARGDAINQKSPVESNADREHIDPDVRQRSIDGGFNTRSENRKLFGRGLPQKYHKDEISAQKSKDFRKNPVQLRTTVRPDAAFFDNNGNVRKFHGVDKMEEFRLRMGMRSRHKSKPTVHDYYSNYRPIRPFGSNGVNPYIGKKKEDKKPHDAFEGLLDGLDLSMKPTTKSPFRHNHHFGDSGTHGDRFSSGGRDSVSNQRSSNGNAFNNKRPMGYDNQRNTAVKQIGNRDFQHQNNNIYNRNLPYARGQSGQMNHANGNIPQQVGGQNQFVNPSHPGPDSAFRHNAVGSAGQAWNNRNQYGNIPQQLGGHNQYANQRFPGQAGQVNGYRPNQVAGTGQPWNRRQVMRNNQPMGRPGDSHMNPDEQQRGNQRPPYQQTGNNQFEGNNRPYPDNRNIVTPVQRNLEQQIQNPLPSLNPARQVPKAEESVPLLIEDLRQPLEMNAECIPFHFLTGDAPLCINENGGHLNAHLKTAKSWEPEAMKQFAFILKSDDSMGVIDIGAGIGVYTMAAALLGRSVVAVEPQKTNYRLLHKSAFKNQVTESIILVKQALDKENYIGLLVKEYEDADNFHIQKLQGAPVGQVGKDIVYVSTLNQLVKIIPFRKALLKLDVGSEMERNILDGGSEFFKILNVPFVMTHWTNEFDMNVKMGMHSILAKLGYSPKERWDGPVITRIDLIKSRDFVIWHRMG